MRLKKIGYGVSKPMSVSDAVEYEIEYSAALISGSAECVEWKLRDMASRQARITELLVERLNLSSEEASELISGYSKWELADE